MLTPNHLSGGTGCHTGKSFSEALILESVNPQDIVHWIPRKIQFHNMLCTNIVLNVKTKTKKQFLYTTCCELVFFGELNEQYLVILWVNWCKNEGFWKRFTCNPSYLLKNHLHFKVRIILVQKVFTQGTHLEKANEHRILQKCVFINCPYFWS